MQYEKIQIGFAPENYGLPYYDSNNRLVNIDQILRSKLREWTMLDNYQMQFHVDPGFDWN